MSGGFSERHRKRGRADDGHVVPDSVAPVLDEEADPRRARRVEEQFILPHISVQYGCADGTEDFPLPIDRARLDAHGSRAAAARHGLVDADVCGKPSVISVDDEIERGNAVDAEAVFIFRIPDLQAAAVQIGVALNGTGQAP